MFKKLSIFALVVAMTAQVAVCTSDLTTDEAKINEIAASVAASIAQAKEAGLTDKEAVEVVVESLIKSLPESSEANVTVRSLGKKDLLIFVGGIALGVAAVSAYVYGPTLYEWIKSKFAKPVAPVVLPVPVQQTAGAVAQLTVQQQAPQLVADQLAAQQVLAQQQAGAVAQLTVQQQVPQLVVDPLAVQQVLAEQQADVVAQLAVQDVRAHSPNPEDPKIDHVVPLFGQDAVDAIDQLREVSGDLGIDRMHLRGDIDREREDALRRVEGFGGVAARMMGTREANARYAQTLEEEGFDWGSI